MGAAARRSRVTRPIRPISAALLQGAALGETLGLGSRVLHPLHRNAPAVRARRLGSARWMQSPTALKSVIARHGPDAVAFYLSGQLLTEDYYLANKLMKGFISALPHVDTNSRLCMASTVAGQRRVFGSDTVPGSYEDLDRADLIVLVGSKRGLVPPGPVPPDAAERAQRGARIVVIDPRATATSEDVDRVLRLAPGSDTLLFAGLLVHLADHGLTDADYLTHHVEGFDAALVNAREIAPSLEAVLRADGAPRDRDRRLLRALERDARRRHRLEPGRQPVGAGHGQGRGDPALPPRHRPHRQAGLRAFFPHGQPNAMGGREVGGLANMLAAHMGYARPRSTASGASGTRPGWRRPKA